MKKVLFVINTLGCAGAEKALLELLRRFTPDKYQVSLFVLMGQGELIHQVPEYVELLNQYYSDSSVLSDAGKKELRKRVLTGLVSHGSLFKNLPYLIKNGILTAAVGRFSADKLLRRILADGAWRTTKHYDLAVAYLEGGSNYYVSDYVDAEKKAAFIHVDYGRAGYTRSLDKDCYRRIDRIFAVSDEVKQSFLEVYPECGQKTEVFHNLLNQEEIRKKAKLPGGFEDDYAGIRILTVGRLTAQKAYEVAIDAMRLLKDRGVQARWYVIGEGELQQKLQQKIASLGLEKDFLLLGGRENPYPYFDQTDIYVHATRFEGKSIAIQEAQTLGCPILVSDCSGNREQVKAGVDGLMCELTPEGICEGITELIRDEEKRKNYGRMAARKDFSGEEDIGKLVSMIQA